MAINGNSSSFAFMEFPLSISRQDAFPLDRSAVYYSLDNAKNYAKTSPLAYVGQLISVVENDVTTVYAIKNSAGDLLKFTDTTATIESANTLTNKRAIDGVQFDGSSDIIHYGVCSTASSTVEKVVNCANYTLTSGSKITVKFNETSTVASATLNVNATGAKNIYYSGSAVKANYLSANKTYDFVYNGTEYDLIGGGVDNPENMGFGYAISNNSATTVGRTASLTDYELVKNGYVSIKFNTAVTSSATLNISSKGAKPIFYKGSAIDANIIKQNDIATFIYDGTNYQLVALDAPKLEVFTGATDTTDGEKGLVPQPTSEDTLKYLKGDGTWSDITNELEALNSDNIVVNSTITTGISIDETYNLPASYIVGSNDLFLSIDGITLSKGIDYNEVGTTGSESSTIVFLKNLSTNKHILKEVVLGRTVYIDSEKLNELSINQMVGATSTTDGTSGIVPQPTKDSYNKFLKGDGTWAEVSNVLDDTILHSVIEDLEESEITTIDKTSDEMNIMNVDSSEVTINFTPAESSVYAKKMIYLTATEDTELSVTGAEWANNEEPPEWGKTGYSLLFEAIFVGGRVILHTLDNNQVSYNIQNSYDDIDIDDNI